MTDPKTTQLDKFKEAARDLGCDEDEQGFKDRLKDLAKGQTKARRESERLGSPKPRASFYFPTRNRPG